MSVKKKNTGLGKGLDALFGDIESPSTTEESGIKSLSLNEIKPNAGQPRKVFNKEAIDELAASIKEHGIIQPIIVRPHGKGYEIVAGERRYRAAREVGLKEVPCLVRELTDEENMLLAIIENMQREDLNPIEEAEGLEKMISTYGLTQEQVSKSVSKSRPYITNSLRILKLPEEVRNLISEGKISSGHGRTLLALASAKEQKEMAKRIEKEGLSVRALEATISGEGQKKRPKPRKLAKNPEVAQVEEDLKKILGTKVNLKQSGNKGKIEIEYYSREELERLIEILRDM